MQKRTDGKNREKLVRKSNRGGGRGVFSYYFFLSTHALSISELVFCALWTVDRCCAILREVRG